MIEQLQKETVVSQDEVEKLLGANQIQILQYQNYIAVLETRIKELMLAGGKIALNNKDNSVKSK